MTRAGMSLGQAIRDAAIAAAVAFGLFVMLVGLRTEVGPEGGLVLRQRWGQVALLCGIVFAGRLAITTLAGRRALQPSTAPGRLPMPPSTAAVKAFTPARKPM